MTWRPHLLWRAPITWRGMQSDLPADPRYVLTARPRRTTVAARAGNWRLTWPRDAQR